MKKRGLGRLLLSGFQKKAKPKRKLSSSLRIARGTRHSPPSGGGKAKHAKASVLLAKNLRRSEARAEQNKQRENDRVARKGKELFKGLSRRHPARILRLSQMQGNVTPRPRKSKVEAIVPAEILPELTPELTKTPSPPEIPLELSNPSLQDTPAQVVENPVQVPAPEPVLVAVPVPAPVQLPQQLQFSLTTQDIIRPNDQLKQSIEGFLMDQRSPHTRRAYGKDLKRFVQFLLARNYQQGIESLTRTVLISYKESLLAEGLEHTTVDRHLATLRSFFKWLVDDGLLVKSPADGVRFLNPKRVSRTNGFTDEEVRKILTIPDLHTRTGAMHYAILMVLFYCGLRRSELCELRTIHLGMERNQRLIRLRGKGNAERIIVLLPAVWSALRYYFYIANRSFASDEYLFVPVKNNRTGVLDKPLDSSMIFYIVTKYARLAGVANRVSPHSCRATAISNARDHHVPDRAIQEFAGWASPDMITRYDKRKSSIVDSAAHGISYGADDRAVPHDESETQLVLPVEQEVT